MPHSLHPLGYTPLSTSLVLLSALLHKPKPVGYNDFFPGGTRMAAILDQNGLVDRVDLIRLDIGRRLDPAHRAAMGQFFTPAPIARFMADLSETSAGTVRLLDPGAGIGSLSAAWIARACGLEQRPSSIHLTAYEADLPLAGHLRQTVKDCEDVCRAAGVAFQAEVIEADFIRCGR